MSTYELRVNYSDGTHEIASVSAVDIEAAVSLALGSRKSDGATDCVLLCVIDTSPQTALAFA
jgi:hypothetical protein